MRGVQLVEVDIEDDFIEVKKETMDCAEILEACDQSFLCIICGKTHSKTMSCSGDYGIFKTEVFLCHNQECGKMFESEIELKQHEDSCQDTSDLPLIETTTAIVQDEDSYLLRSRMKKCKDCQKMFTTKLLYLKHMRIFHPDLIKCSLLNCNQFFRKHTDFEEHRLRDHKNLVFCAICKRDCRSKSTLMSHLLKQHLQQRKKKEPNFEGSVAGKTKCPHCCNFYKRINLHAKLCNPDRIVKSQPICCRDFLSAEAIQKSNLKCKSCRKHFSTKYNLERHVLNHHSSGRLTECCHCGEFTNIILTHVKTFHPDKLFKCTQARCRKLFVTEMSLRDHLQKFHSLIKCAHCDVVFERRYMFISHMYSYHLSESSFKCSFTGCIHFFKNQVEMEKHYMENHPFQVKCELCGHLAPTLRVLEQHMKRKHHGDFANKTINNEGKTKCTYCGTFVKTIQMHLKLEHPKEMLKRSQGSCCRDFSTEVELQKHRIEAHNAIKCIFCDLVFNHKFVYIQHVVIHAAI